MKIGNRFLRHWCAVFWSVMFVSIAGAALAEPYPNKPIRIIVPAPPGGGSDLFVRLIGEELQKAWGQPVIADYRGGAGGSIGTELAARAAPDGYTLVLVTLSHVINPSLYRELLYDPVKDFAPITQLSSQAYVLAVHPSVPAKTVKELIAFAKSKNGGITYASSGIGQPGHLAMELLKTLAGFDAVHVPYKGAAPAMTDLLAGQVDALFASMPSAVQNAGSGKLKILAVTSLKRTARFPDIPTVAEAGFPGYEVDGWYGLLAPSGTPPDIVTKLYDEISRILKLPDVRDRLLANGLDPVGTTPEAFAARIKAEVVVWGKVVKQSGARVE